MDLVELARTFVEDAHPDVLGALLGGSTAEGRATPSSDLDVVLIFPDSSPSYAETLSYKGRLVEVFAHTPESMRFWNEREVAERRPVLAGLCARSVVLGGGEYALSVQRNARQLLAERPSPLTQWELDTLRYGLSAGLDDLLDARDPAEGSMLQGQIFRSTAELLLQLERVWLGHGKWLVRQLRAADDPLADRLGLWAAGPGDRAELVEIVGFVLDRAGGYLQEGFLRGSKSS